MKNRSKDELTDNIDQEFTWRFHEIASMKTTVKSMKDDNKALSPMVRCLVMLSYAHWEGFVKYSSRYFFDYMNYLGLNKSQTNLALVASSLRYSFVNRRKRDINDLIYQALNDDHYKPRYNSDVMADADSNLNYEILEIISSNLGVDITSLSLKQNLLDEIVLGRRNKMAHGEFDKLDKTYGLEVADAVLYFMQQFKTIMENMIVQEEFRR